MLFLDLGLGGASTPGRVDWTPGHLQMDSCAGSCHVGWEPCRETAQLVHGSKALEHNTKPQTGVQAWCGAAPAGRKACLFLYTKLPPTNQALCPLAVNTKWGPLLMNLPTWGVGRGGAFCSYLVSPMNPLLSMKASSACKAMGLLKVGTFL